MTPYYSDPWLTVYQGDCREVMRSMEPESVHCVVTSPPYWGLRDYGQTDQLGLESTPEEYVANLVAVFREVRRVLRNDGTVWLNLGDSYASTPPGIKEGGVSQSSGLHGVNGASGQYRETLAAGHGTRRSTIVGSLKPKDLVGIPWRVAFALQADGWYLRSDIIWAKPNPMPESVTDRPTKSHEYLFLLSKSPRYYYDADAVAEPLTETSIERLSQPSIDHQLGSDRVPGKTNGNMKAVGGPSWQERKAAGATPGSHGVGMLVGSGTQRNVHGAGLSHDLHTKPTRNLRSVWTIATQPYPGAHFATFPRKLVEPCIKAGTSERGVCPECGAPWVRVVERTERDDAPRDRPSKNVRSVGRGAELKVRPGVPNGQYDTHGETLAKWSTTTTDWRPMCNHGDPVRPPRDPIPATVLDPFAGSGTTGVVAQSLNRRAILIDLNGDYLVQAMQRNRDIPLGLGAA